MLLKIACMTNAIDKKILISSRMQYVFKADLCLETPYLKSFFIINLGGTV